MGYSRGVGVEAGRRLARDWVLASAFGVLPVEAVAQSSTSAASVAIDAFGERVGSEQIGLYSEQQVRGFSLQESGNYRIDSAYFIRSANIVPLTLDGTTIRVGVNALGIDFPAPSGIVEYRLATAPPGARAEIELTLSDYGGQAYLVRGSVADAKGELGAAYGINVMNSVGPEGQKRFPRHYALVPTWQPSDKFRLRGFFSADRFSRPGGDYGVIVNGLDLPPPQPNPGKYYVDWGAVDQWQLAGGVVARYAPSDTIGWQSSFVVTDLDRWRSDFTRLTLGADGTGTGNAVRGGETRARSYAGETRLNWRPYAGHRLFGTLRWRLSTNEVTPGQSAPIPFVDQDLGVITPPEPTRPPGLGSTLDTTRQMTAGLGYEFNPTPSTWFRGAVQHSRYEKEVAAPSSPIQSNVEDPWLYDLAVSVSPRPSLTFFATTVRGLEESGTAPANAANRNEVLPAVIATQYELGVRYRISPTITFISSLFEISKPTPGFDAQGVYGLIGDARHRGVELSVVGRPFPSLNVVSGLVFLDPARHGPLIDQGILVGRAAGTPSVTGLLNVTYQVPGMRGLSIDGQITSNSRMLVNPRTGLETSGYAVLDVGARYTFEIRGAPTTLRFRVGNVLDEDQWVANRNETVGRVPRRAFRLSLTTNLG